MPHAVSPREITPAKFSAYTASWRQLLESGNSNSLNAHFTSKDTRLNYAYLRQEQVARLVEAGTARICSKFALVPHESGTGEVFAIVFYSDDNDDSDNAPASGYQLSGVAEMAAVITGCESGIVSPLPFELACKRIKGWGELPSDGLAFSFFRTMNQPLRGYTHDVEDFEAASNAALWFIFSLHSGEGSDPNEVLFDTVLTWHTEPDADVPGTILLTYERLYYDIAHPCPPACGIIDRT